MAEKKEYNKEYYSKNKDKHAKAMKVHYEGHREEYLERSRRQNAEWGKDKRSAYNKAYYEKNRAELCRKRRERYAEGKRRKEGGD